MLSDTEFLERFDAGTLDPAAFDHAAHVRVGWLCLRAAPFRDALARVRRGLKRLAISAGQPQRYHETLTVAFMRLIHRQMRFLGSGAGWAEFQAKSTDLFEPGLAAVRAIYAAEVLDSPEARRAFVPPAAWNIEPVERFLREFAQYQDSLEERLPGDPGLDVSKADEAGTPPEPVCVTAVLAVPDVARTAAWYGATFGFDVAPFPQRPPYQFALLSRGGAELMLRASGETPLPAPAAGWSLYVRLSGGRIRELFATLAAESEIVRPLQRMPYHDVEFEVRDPDGHIVVVSEWLEQSDDVPPAGTG